MGVPTLRRRAERRGLRLWPVGRVLVLAFAAAVLVAAAVFHTGWDLLGARGLKPEHRIDSKTLFDLVKLSFGVVAGAGALVALVVAYRRQRVDEDRALREATLLHTERFTTAVGQLGNESAAVRLGGVHALAGLADDAPTRDLRQTCIDVLCAYLRLPCTAEADLPAGDAEARHAYLAWREVRHPDGGRQVAPRGIGWSCSWGAVAARPPVRLCGHGYRSERSRSARPLICSVAGVRRNGACAGRVES
ncbi:hypothetical protein ACWDSD_27150 [Streptomyces spiralis]